jgi:hypothetical protein
VFLFVYLNVHISLRSPILICGVTTTTFKMITLASALVIPTNYFVTKDAYLVVEAHCMVRLMLVMAIKATVCGIAALV